MPNMPSGVGGKWAKSRGSTNRMSFRDASGRRVSRATLKTAFQKTYAKQYATDLGQSAWRDQEMAATKFKKGVRQRAAGTRQRARAKGRRKAA